MPNRSFERFSLFLTTLLSLSIIIKAQTPPDPVLYEGLAYGDPEGLLSPYCQTCCSFEPCEHRASPHDAIQVERQDVVPPQWHPEIAAFESAFVDPRTPPLYNRNIYGQNEDFFDEVRRRLAAEIDPNFQIDVIANNTRDAYFPLQHVSPDHFNAFNAFWDDTHSPPQSHSEALDLQNLDLDVAPIKPESLHSGPVDGSAAGHGTSSLTPLPIFHPDIHEFACRDFIHRQDSPITLRGSPSHINDLLQRVNRNEHYNRQPTAADSSMCALFALEISLRDAPQPEHDPYDPSSPSYNHLYDILQRLALNNQFLLNGNLDDESILNVLHLYGRRTGMYQLGIVCATQDPGVYTCNVWTLNRNAPIADPYIIWVFNDNGELLYPGNGFMSHWSGIALDLEEQRIPFEVAPKKDIPTKAKTQTIGKLKSQAQKQNRTQTPYDPPKQRQKAAKGGFRCLADGCKMVKDTQGELTAHEKSHKSQGERHFKCPNCEYRANDGKDVRRHMPVHDDKDSTTRIMIQCLEPSCQSEFPGPRKDNMHRHVRTSHVAFAYSLGLLPITKKKKKNGKGKEMGEIQQQD
ncbi:hypothetical protein K402DRAFT_397298 [Aulographum hederae CBS 113979]|uniref:C2H2-type domain-containing protein n=1 Tax=Aulographum hederae CBS 113979 TaxID=1176131 RepID=A0A6G1GPB1_9PEZI|nr:hypothetical protein K402DRAFT_397298 [Aulographum hederae CBS 113979]